VLRKKFNVAATIVLSKQGFRRFYRRMQFKDDRINKMWLDEVDEDGNKLQRRGTKKKQSSLDAQGRR